MFVEALLAEFGQGPPTPANRWSARTDDRLDWKPHEKSMTLGRLDDLGSGLT